MSSQRYAVLIGNGAFIESEQQLRSLRCPANDVKSLAELLKAAHHGGYAVTKLVDATHDIARRTVYKCLQNAERDDLVLVYFSGHGRLDQDGNLYLVTKDTSVAELPPTSFPVDDLKRYIRDSRVATTIVILDCCFSGAIEKLYKGEIADQATSAIRKLENQGTFYLTASTDTQFAEEKEGDDHSLLTKHIIAGISEGLADYDDDGRISFQELCAYVQRQVPKEGKQRPRNWAINTAGEVIVAYTGKPAAEARRRAVIKKVYELASQELLTAEVVSDLLKIINLPPLTELQPNLSVRDLIELLYSKNTLALFIEDAVGYAAVLRNPVIRGQLRGEEQGRLQEERKDEEQAAEARRLIEEQRKAEQHAAAAEARRRHEEQAARLMEKAEEQARLEKAARIRWEKQKVEEQARLEETARNKEKQQKTEERTRVAEHNRKVEEQLRVLIEEQRRIKEQAHLAEENKKAEEQTAKTIVPEPPRVDLRSPPKYEYRHHTRPFNFRKFLSGLCVWLYIATAVVWVIGWLNGSIHGTTHVYMGSAILVLLLFAEVLNPKY